MPDQQNPLRDMAAWLWPWAVWAVLLLVLTLIFSQISPAMARITTDTLIKLVIVTGLYIFVGNSGILSFGHGAFLIVAAYASAWVTIPVAMKGVILPGLPEMLRGIQISPLGGLVAGVVLAAVLGLLAGIPLMRLSGIAASIATFAFFIVISVIYNNWTDWTKGTASLVGLPTWVGPWAALAAALTALLIAWAFQNSRAGLLLRASREDLVAAHGAGIRVMRLRLLAFVLSAAVAGAGGVLLGHNNGALTTANNVYLNLSFIVIAMLVVGGIRSMSGVVVGTLVLSVLAEIFRRFETAVDIGGVMLQIPGGTREVLLGLCMLLALILRPDGLSRGREMRVPGILRGTRPGAKTKKEEALP
jgi:branched-chain amino acid transport system permease protein